MKQLSLRAGRLSLRTIVVAAVIALAPPAASAEAATRYLAPSGSDGSACSQAAPCQSFDRAYRVAAPGDVVQLAGGSYGSQTIGIDGSKTSAADVVFRPVSGAQVHVAYLSVEGRHVGFENLETSGWHVRPDADDVTFRNVDSSERIFISSATNVSVYGGVVDGGGRYWSNGNQVKRASDYATIPANILFDGVTIRNFRKDPSGSDHVDCLHVFSGSGITVRNSRFENCEAFGILFTRYLGPTPINLLVEDNYFGSVEGYYALQLGGGHGEAHANVLVQRNTSKSRALTAGTDNTLSNVTFRDNAANVTGCDRSGITCTNNNLATAPGPGPSPSPSPSPSPTPAPSPSPEPSPEPSPAPSPSPGQALSVTLTAPTAGTTFSSILPMRASASGPNAISKVVFYKGARYRIATDWTAPYSYTWKPGSHIAVGPLTIRAVATDVQGNVAEASVAVTRTSAGTLASVSTANATRATRRARTERTRVVSAADAPRWARRATRIRKGARRTRVVTGHTATAHRSVRLAIERRERRGWRRVRTIRARRAGGHRFAAAFRGAAGERYRAFVAD